MSNPVFDAVVAGPPCRIGIRLAQGELTAIDFLPPRTPLLPPATPMARMVAEMLEEYFAGHGMVFDLPLAAADSPFRRRLREALLGIPAGETRTYGEIAVMLGSSARAVGGGCRANPLPIVVPCHRVVAAHGIGGFDGSVGGPLITVKRWLLELERGYRGEG